MAGGEYTTPSGAKLLVTLASIQVGKELTQAIAKAVRQGGLASKLPENIATLFSLKSQEDFFSLDLRELGGFGDIVIDILTSPEVEAALIKCLSNCNYNDERITGIDFFDPPQRRGDYFWVLFTIGRDNIAPFFSLLLSGSRATSPQVAPSQR